MSQKLPLILGTVAVVSFPFAWFSFDRTQAGATALPTSIGVSDAKPEAAAELTVIERDAAVAGIKSFQVKLTAAGWVIPSHHDYPADDKDGRVAKVAGLLLDLKPTRLATSDPKKHAELGVLDPQEKSTDSEGHGQSIEIKDSTGAKMVSIILGKPVPDAKGSRFVRPKDQDAVYTVNFLREIPDKEKPEKTKRIDASVISQRFVDYVQPDPFKIERNDVRRADIIDYTLDIAAQDMTPRSTTRFDRKDEAWSTAQAPTGKQVNKSTLDSMLSTLSGLRLQGVRPFNPQWLPSRGFLPINSAKYFQAAEAVPWEFQGKKYAVFSAEGRVDIATSKGLVYSFLIGSPALEDEQDTKEDAAPLKDSNLTGKPRYVAVFVRYVPEADELSRPQPTPDSKPEELKPDAKLVEEHRRTADRLNQRFTRFFYVISDYDFKALRPEAAKLFEDQPEYKAQDILGGKSVAQWLDENGKKEGVTTTASGLQYQVLARGPADGLQPTAADKVVVAYKGTLIDNKQFDANESAEFPVTGVVQGWIEGLQLMRVGDQFRFWIKPSLGYGDRAEENIPANSILVFEVTLKGVVRPEAPKTDAPKAEAPATEAPKGEPPKP